jgi:hypothetical protein
VVLARTEVSEERTVSVIKVKRINDPVATLAIFLRSVLQSLVTANVPSSLILSTPIMDAIRSSETSVLARATRRHNPEDGILHSHRHGNLKSYNLTLNLLSS